jgi:Tfp pilus assembly protein PilX
MSMNQFKKSKRFRGEAGIALITTLLLLFLMSSLLVGFTILVMSNQQLASSNNDDVTAFYGAEAGMEQMTANLGDLFSQTYSPTAGQISTIATNPPLLQIAPGLYMQYMNSDGSSGYNITPTAVDNFGNPAPTISTIKSGTYSGMYAMLTEYTLVVNARTPGGREVKLQRSVQTVGIPMYQFGIFSDTDLSFFPGPNFQFGGRTHTNGNLFLAAGSTLTLADKVDAYKDVIRTNLENGWPTSSNYTGTVQITTQPGGSNYRALGTNEGSLTGTLGSSANASWPTISTGNAPTYYNSNLVNGQGSKYPQFSTGAKKLDLGIVTIGSGTTQEIDLIRRPLSGEAANVTGERYFAQASLKVLVSDDPNDLMNLPCIDASTQPFDLSKMATQPATWLASPYAPLVALYNKMIANGVTPLPLAASGALGGGGGAYNSQDGYWLPNGYPVIKGFLKIEEQIGYGSPCGTWKDVTIEVLSYGYVGRNIDPVPQSLDGAKMNPQWSTVGTATCTSVTACAQMDPLKGAFVATTNPNGGYTVAGNQLTTTAWGYAIPKVPMTTAPAPLPLAFQNGPTFTAGGATLYPTAVDALAAPTNTCPDPHPWAIIRLERIRDNPSSLYVGGYVASGTLKTTAPVNLPKQAPIAMVCGVDPATGKLPLIGANPWVPTLYDFWPNTLFDTREGTLRDSAMNNANPALPTLNGTMHYIELDGKNLSSWFGGKLNTWTTSGLGTKDPAVAPNNFLVYVSDRRGNYAASQSIAGGWPPLSYTRKETGEFGWNDLVNFPVNSTTGCPTNALESGEDADGTGVLYYYGANESYIHAAGVTPVTSLANGQIGIFNNLSGTAVTANVNCATVPSYVTNGIWPMMVATATDAARENPALFFRRALKVVNASNLSAVGTCPGGNNCGLAIAAENPLYIQGDYNANLGGIGFANAPSTISSSVSGDAVTLLSNNWNDTNSFSSPYSLSGRSGVDTWYRVAVIGGATPWFSNPSGVNSQDYGTDGGVHNFLRYIEAWSGTLNYEGSIIYLYTSRQANSTFKCCNTVYSPPTRGYKFDNNFLNPQLLPPRTPLLRDINTTGWTRLLLASQ